MADLHFILNKYWGYENFRPQQEEIISSILGGKDTLALLPTGGGKSICYQVPALAQDGICIVLSPLIALMRDQVENLKKRNIPALVIYSGMDRKDILRTLENARQDYFKFLYVSPERLESSLFKEYLPAFNVNLIAVDEAHCISQWGYDFRPSYLNISELRKELPGVPVLAVTASATEDVQNDICEKLLFKEKTIFRQSFERKNLSYSAFKVDSKINKLLHILKGVPGTAIVYCKTRKRTNEITNLLQMHGISALNYHAGLPQDERTKRQQDWIDNKVQNIVCTNAFGMGIDKADVRLVVHVDLPDSLEYYYQEAGRCGRDGKKAYAVLLYNDQDVKELALLHETRYPSFEDIKKVYEALVNYLQIPVNTGQDQTYTFQFDVFVKNFKLNIHLALYALKALEQDGWIIFNERNFTPSTLVFTTTKDVLYDFYKTYPQHEELCTTLLRNYDRIFDFPAFISEHLLSNILHITFDEIKKELKKIESLGILKHTHQNDEPNITFRKNRVVAKDLHFNLFLYKKRKEVFIKRVDQIIQYTELITCRSERLSRYFGDIKAKACGICDNCLKQQKFSLTNEDFSEISTSIRKYLATKTIFPDELFLELKHLKKEKIWKVLQFLEAEGIVTIDKEGALTLS